MNAHLLVAFIFQYFREISKTTVCISMTHISSIHVPSTKPSHISNTFSWVSWWCRANYSQESINQLILKNTMSATNSMFPGKKRKTAFVTPHRFLRKKMLLSQSVPSVVLPRKRYFWIFRVQWYWRRYERSRHCLCYWNLEYFGL